MDQYLILPASVNHASNNLKNLFELPVVFYALCAVLLVSQSVDAVYLYCAWAFVGLRVLHSLIHCTVNIVRDSWRISFPARAVVHGGQAGVVRFLIPGRSRASCAGRPRHRCYRAGTAPMASRHLLQPAEIS